MIGKLITALLILGYIGVFWAYPTTTWDYTKQGFQYAGQVAKIGILAIVDGDARERISPADHIPENDIKVMQGDVLIETHGKELRWSKFADTNSMDPVLDTGANGLEIVPETPDEIKIGDIVAYEKGKDIIVHRVIEKGEDEKGVFFKCKGDNNLVADAGKIRFKDIEGIVVAVIY